MSFLTKLFGGSHDRVSQPDIRFGRFSDAYKTAEQYDAWDRAIELFEEKKYMQSYLHFFEYLENPEEDNVTLQRRGQVLDFQLRQGSLLIHGRIDGKRIRVEAALAEAERRPQSLLRRLMEMNYNLKYSRYALDEHENICIVFDTFLIDGSPYKLYYGLKELAIQADKLDDLLLEEFPFLEPVEREHIRPIPDEEKEVKYTYLCDSLDRLFHVVDEGPLDIRRHPNTGMYLILEACYRLDYLLLPEGSTRDIFEKIHGLFAAHDGVHPTQKIERAKKLLQTVRTTDKSTVFEELYEVSSTFGRIAPVDYEWVSQFIGSERPNMDWYLEQDLEEYALAVSGYIIGYQLFNFALPAPIRSLFHLYYQVVEEQFFGELGYDSNFHSRDDKPRAKGIEKQLSMVEDYSSEREAGMDIPEDVLHYSSDGEWARSFLDMIRGISVGKRYGTHG